MKQEILKDKISSVITSNPGGLTISQISDILGLYNSRLIIPILRDLLGAGFLMKKGVFFYKS